jgi:hypothetical protein
LNGTFDPLEGFILYEARGAELVDVISLQMQSPKPYRVRAAGF